MGKRFFFGEFGRGGFHKPRGAYWVKPNVRVARVVVRVVVVRVLEAGETPVPAEQRRRDDLAIGLCELWGSRVTPQQRLRALRIAIPRDYATDETLPAHTLGERVAWIIVDGKVVQDGGI